MMYFELQFIFLDEEVKILQLWAHLGLHSFKHLITITFVPRAKNSDYIEPDDELDTIDTANDIIETKGPNINVGYGPEVEEEQARASLGDTLGRSPQTFSLAPAVASCRW